jgi:hypothetical protein
MAAYFILSRVLELDSKHKDGKSDCQQDKEQS